MDVLSDVIGAMRAGRPYASLTEVSEPWAMTFPAFEGARFHVVTAGVCRVVGGVTLSAGDAVLFPRGAAHGLENVVGGETQIVCGAYQLDQARAHPLISELPDVVHLRAGAPGLSGVVALLREELGEQAPGQDVVLPALLDVLLVRLIRAWFVEDGREVGWGVALGDQVIVRVLQVIHSRPGEAWTVASLGEVAGLSRAAFARRFTAVVGQPPLAYLTWWRLTSGARMLRGSDAPLAAVALRSGYGSAYAFAHAFKREYGVSAGRYRLLRRGDAGSISEWDRVSG